MSDIQAANVSLNTWTVSSQQAATGAKSHAASIESQMQAENNNAVNPGKPKYDHFVKSDGKTEEVPGIYRMEKDENGKPRILFDSPSGAGDSKKPEGNDEKDDKIQLGKSVGDDSEWQAEIAKIKQKRSQVLRQIRGAGGDEEKRKALDVQLAQVDAELASKDTDSYRKQRTKVIYLGETQIDKKDAGKYR